MQDTVLKLHRCVVGIEVQSLKMGAVYIYSNIVMKTNGLDHEHVGGCLPASLPITKRPFSLVHLDNFQAFILVVFLL